MPSTTEPAPTESAEKTRPSRRIRFAVDDTEAAEFSSEPTFAVHYPEDARKLDVLQRNPLVPAGAALTAAVLLGGLFAFNRGNQIWSQRMMRARVVAQGATLALLAHSVYAIRADPQSTPAAPKSTDTSASTVPVPE